METKPTDLALSGKHCPVCGHKLTVTPKDEEYILCMECGMIRTKHNYDGSQYSTDYALNYLKYAKSPCNTQLNLFRLGLISRWLSEDAIILDIGCCVGEFIRFAERYYKCIGFEPNPVAAREATKRVHSTINTELNGYLGGINCVTLFDVIEHLQEPREVLYHIHSILAPGGIVAITTPDAEAINHSYSISDREVRAWKHYKPKEHLYLHTSSSIDTLVKSSGFDPVYWGYEESEIRPGNPDQDILTCVARRTK